MSDYGPSLTAARLYRKKSKNGATYFVGRWGMLKLAVLKSKEVADDGTEIWNILVSQAPAPKQQGERRVVTDTQAPLPERDRGPELNDDLPF